LQALEKRYASHFFYQSIHLSYSGRGEEAVIRDGYGRTCKSGLTLAATLGSLI
jgi:hypothetical protein